MLSNTDSLYAATRQFTVIQKGKNDLERDIKEFLGKVKAGEEQSWDDIRRVARLYDTGVRWAFICADCIAIRVGESVILLPAVPLRC